jgi:tRNA A-37 threonylcarbamoyl transferase component Bud32
MDDDVARLIREERIAAAASLASARGDAKTASELFERACEWQRAAHEALRASDPARALRLSVLARDEPLAERALSGLRGDRDACRKIGLLLERQGDHLWAARTFELADLRSEAAQAWERAGNAVRAAELLEAAHDVVGAARVLETATRRAPENFANQVALGQLLLRYGKNEAAVRALQTVPRGAAERRTALVALVAALEPLGLRQALEEARAELSTLPAPAVEILPLPSVPEAEPVPDVRTRIFGRYEVVREVASTASARVLECVDAVRGDRVAVKLFAGHGVGGAGRDVLIRFEREVKVLGSLDHPNVVPLHDYFPDGPALVLSWMPGGTLEQMMASGPIAPARAVEIACAVLNALGEAHRLGVLHRDVKPSNVLFDAAGVARLGDFGAAHFGDLSITATAGLIGTLAYMSPEQYQGKPATVASDVFGAGAILFEMLTGERLPQDGHIAVRPSGVHRDLGAAHDRVVLSLIARDPEDRPTDAFAARRALSALPWPTTVEPAAIGPRSGRAPSDHPPPPSRIVRDAAGRDIDVWIGRAVERVPLDALTLQRAVAFARADHPALQTVLRVDRQTEEIWLEGRRGHSLDRALSPEELGTLRQALAALHQAGITHGSIDRAHVHVSADGAVTLAFSRSSSPTDTADRDHIALARLG